MQCNAFAVEEVCVRFRNFLNKVQTKDAAGYAWTWEIIIHFATLITYDNCISDFLACRVKTLSW